MTKTYFPGYFWDTVENELYSIKIGGVLKKLPKIKVNKWTIDFCDSWHIRVSHQGCDKIFSDRYLMRLSIRDSQIPYKKDFKK